jgi:hypothetical protein
MEYDRTNVEFIDALSHSYRLSKDAKQQLFLRLSTCSQALKTIISMLQYPERAEEYFKAEATDFSPQQVIQTKELKNNDYKTMREKETRLKL